jgi:hypothetical protein
MTQPLITLAQLRKWCPTITANLPPERFAESVNNAQILDIQPVIGAKLYAAIVGEYLVSPPTERMVKLMEGDNYDGVIFNGLIPALSYYTFARLLNVNKVNITRYGIEGQDNPDGMAIDAEGIGRAYNERKNVGQAYLNAVKRYLDKFKSVYPEYENCKVNASPNAPIKITNVKAKRLSL